MRKLAKRLRKLSNKYEVTEKDTEGLELTPDVFFFFFLSSQSPVLLDPHCICAQHWEFYKPCFLKTALKSVKTMVHEIT